VRVATIASARHSERFLSFDINMSCTGTVIAMAKTVVTETHYTDDLDGSAAAETINFSIDGANYEIDLSKTNRKAFEKVMAPYVGHARKVRNTRRSSGRRATARAHDLADVRVWAANNGFEVSDRGRVAAAVLDAYDAAH
jgi:hypothetical protein